MKRNILISTAAKRYASALVNAAIKQRTFSKVLGELEVFHDQLQSTPVLQQLFINPAVPLEKKSKVLEELGARLQFQQLTLNFLKVALHRDRLNLLEQIIVSAEEQFLERQGIMVIQVVTARKLEADEEKKLIEILEAVTGKRVQLENKINPALIGGVITKIGTTLYDGSVQVQLEQLKTKIVQLRGQP